MSRTCAACGRDLPQSSYTANQYSKGPGVSRRVGCVHGHNSDVSSTVQSDSGRYNQSDRATFPSSALENPFAQGAFRWVAKGRYTSGPRKGQACVGKWFKTGAVFSNDYFTLDIKAVEKALEIVNRFNQLNIINKVIKINVPTVWTFDDKISSEWSGQKILCEPFIQNYQKFNSNILGGTMILGHGEKSCKPLATLAITCREEIMFCATSKAAFTSTRSSSLTPSSYLGIASTASPILVLTALAHSSVSTTVITSAARTGLSPLT